MKITQKELLKCADNIISLSILLKKPENDVRRASQDYSREEMDSGTRRRFSKKRFIQYLKEHHPEWFDASYYD